ncbi:MAG: hypothetical protein JWN36_2300 [Microbacteriaceae bacterium]|nr:hypothetical protein [Microbacteriaceae bacterium]
MATFQKDRFDDVPEDLLRTGAHRGPQKPGRGWVAFAWAALATGLIVLAGVFAIFVVNGKLNDLPFFNAPSASPTPTVTPTPTAAPKVNPTLPITVLNGTATPGLANSVGDYLVTQGWNGAAEGVGARTNAGSTTIKETVVYYSDPANEAAARAMVLSLKVGTISLSNAYPQSPMVVVIGSDYKLPKS